MDKENDRRDLLIDLGKLVDRDLEFLTKSQDRNVGRGLRAQEAQHEDEIFGDQETFASLLVSVITHSIGLEASAMPLNESPESMLAHLMDIFRLNPNEVENLLLPDTKDKDESGMIQSSKKPKTNQGFSFQPELRLRLNPLVMPRVEDLLVKVYLIQGEAPKQSSKNSTVSSEGPGESKCISEVLRTWGNSDLSPQPVDKKLLAEIKFVKSEDGHDPEVACLHQDLASISSADASELRIRLRQRPSNQFIHFYFILESGTRSKINSIGRLLKLTQSSCCCNYGSGPESPQDSTYGSLDIRVSQIPAYASRLNQSITSARDQLVDNCDIISELRNSDSAKTLSLHEVVLNHARLYCICIAYELKILSGNKITSSPSHFRTNKTNRASPKLDGILSSPALTLINQHRLQFNISQLEDQSIRRSATLLLLTRMAQLNGLKIYSKSHRIFLVMIAEHEYLSAHRHFNNTTRQEVDPFHPKLEYDNSRGQVKTLEYDAIQTTTSALLCERHIKGWVSSIDSMITKPRDMEFLGILKLTRTILSHNGGSACVDSRFKRQSVELDIQINQMITEVLSNELKSRLTVVLSSLNASPQRQQTKRKGLKSRMGNNDKLKRNAQVNQWQSLFCDVQMIENDLTLHWSDKGLKSVKLDRTKLLRPMNDKRLTTLSNIIRNKISNYLMNK